MAILQDHHRKNFNDVNKRLGFASDEHMFKMSHAAFENDRVVFAADPANGHIAGKSIPVASIAELKRLSGIPQDGEDDHVNYPEPLLKLKSTNPGLLSGEGMNDEMRNHIAKAAAAYILGKPEKVKEYEDLINTHMFPGKVQAFTAEDLYIKSGQTVVFGENGDTHIYNFGTITVEKGGQIKVEGHTTLYCQIFTQL